MESRLHAALGDLYAYVLFLDAERDRLGEPAELREELDALRSTIAALRHAPITLPARIVDQLRDA